MEKVVPAITRWAVRTDLPRTPTLAPQVVEAAVLRLRWISLTCAVMTGLRFIWKAGYSRKSASY